MNKRLGATALFVLVVIWFFPKSAKAERENLGTLSISDILLRPSFLVAPASVLGRGFTLGESSFAVKWTYVAGDRVSETVYSGHFRVGPEALVGPPAHYVQSVDPNQIAIVEAYAEMDHPLGRIRAGMLPLDFGLEGAESESDLIFPRALLFEQRIVGLRDLGLSYAIDYNGFFTEFVVHNGEGGSNQDGNYWYTARWGYDFEKMQFGLSGQTGKTSPQATAASGDTLASVDPTQPEKWRLGGIFASYHPKRIRVEMEGYWGQRVQDADGTRGFATGHLDGGYEWTGNLSTYLRYDMIDPDLQVDNDAVYRGAVAVVWTNDSRTSRWIGMYAHDINEGRRADDQYRLIWSLSPRALP